MKEKKSYTAGWTLTFFFGPLGAMYGCWWSGLGLFALTLMFSETLAIMLAGGDEPTKGYLVVWFGSVCIALLDVTLNIFQYNRKVAKENATILAKEAKEEKSRQELIDAIKSLQGSGAIAPNQIEAAINGKITDEQLSTITSGKKASSPNVTQ